MEDLNTLTGSVKAEIIEKIENYEGAIKIELKKERKKRKKDLDEKDKIIKGLREEVKSLQAEGSNKRIHKECCEYVVSGIQKLFDDWNKSVPADTSNLASNGERDPLVVRPQSKTIFATPSSSPGLTSDPTEDGQRQECPIPGDDTSQKPSQGDIRKRRRSEQDSVAENHKRTRLGIGPDPSDRGCSKRRSPRLAKDKDQKVK